MMRTQQFSFHWPCSAFLLLAMTSLAGCGGEFGADGHRADDHPDPDQPSPIPLPACPMDPDCGLIGTCDVYTCPDYWLCDDLPVGNGKRCTNPGPRLPDDGHDWVCRDEGGHTVCRGSEFPDGGGDSGFSCERRNEWVDCTSDAPTYPDDGGPWNCYFEGEFRVCESGTPTPHPDDGGFTCYDVAGGRECRDDTPDFPDDRDWDCYDDEDRTICEGPGPVPDTGGDGPWSCERSMEFVRCENDTPEVPPAGELPPGYPDDGTPWDCRFAGDSRICTAVPPTVPPDGGDVCVAGQQRWCDDAVFCSWGKQTCRRNGTWGRCVEPDVSLDGVADRPATACACRYFYFNSACCEDPSTCLIPDDHAAPVCGDGSGRLCAACDAHTDCGGVADLCIFSTDGYALCGRDCSTRGCPDGYRCADVGASRQCVPLGNPQVACGV